MKKIKKSNMNSKKSVHAFACPCDGYCSTTCLCTTPTSTNSNYTNSLYQYNPHATTLV